MFFFSRSLSFAKSGLLSGYTDWHSHILPGVDDGVETLDESLQILRRYEQIGVRQLWLTPHIMEDIPNRTEDLKVRFAELKEAYSQLETTHPISLHLATENMIDSLFLERLEQDDFLPLGYKEKALLVETSYYNPPINLAGTLHRVQSAGYHVVLAHPERYLYMADREYEQLYGMNVAFQLNLMSLTGAYGKDVQYKARKILSKGWYQLSGSDLHSSRYLDLLLKGKLPQSDVAALKKLFWSEKSNR